ncbi:MAG: cofactor-independent phosphoglycerate mutase [Candidatus Omnitrophota bacterium]
MKYVVVVLDGASDYPIDSLGGKTPLEVADTPCMDSLAKRGVLGRVRTIPPKFTPSSDIANLSLLGYDPNHDYTGRGPLEAANLGLNLKDSDVAFRCNFITETEGVLDDYSAGHISDKEARILIDCLNDNLATSQVVFYTGKGYRHIMLFRDGVNLELDRLTYFAPHDIMGKFYKNYLPKGKNSGLLIELMERSKVLLKEHEINKVRIDLGENPANMMWLWGCGRTPGMEPFENKFGLKGAVISAVDLIKGIGKIIGLRIVEVEGATGYYDTNYLGKAEAALRVLDEVDFVFVHIEAPDEAGHNQDLLMKITCIERIDKMVVKTIVNNLEGSDYRILISPDHSTPVSKRTHTDEPVPFLISGSGIKGGNSIAYSELEAQNSSIYFDRGIDLLNYFFAK